MGTRDSKVHHFWFGPQKQLMPPSSFCFLIFLHHAMNVDVSSLDSIKKWRQHGSQVTGYRASTDPH